MKAPTAAILSVGTELLLGQTLNRHGSWLSARLAHLGIETCFHLTVADDKPAILEGLRMATAQADLIFVTGGLGPTTDDFTREVVANFLNRPLVWSEPAWQHIFLRLQSFGSHIHEFQRQQAFFPADSHVLENSRGTAHGFYIDKESSTSGSGKQMYFVLPGPPVELQGIWTDHIHHLLQLNFATIDPLIVHTWDTLGYGESEIAVRVEAALADSGIVPGYRVHIPYTEVKLMYRKSHVDVYEPLVQKIEQAIGEWTVLRDQKKSTSLLADALRGRSFCLADEVSEGFLMKALMAEEKFLQKNDYRFTNKWSDDDKTKFDCCLRASFASDKSVRAEVWFNYGKDYFEVTRESTITSPALRERQKQELIERATIFWIYKLITPRSVHE